MLPHEHFSRRHYFTLGLRLFLLTGLLMSLFISFFTNQISATWRYEETVCEMISLDIHTVNVDCFGHDGSIRVVQIPCIVAFVDTKKFKNIPIYRNFEEKEYTKSKKVNCSLLVPNCEVDQKYIAKLLNELHASLFPSPMARFNCYVSRLNGHADSLIFLPDKKAFYSSLVILTFGLIISFSFVFYGLKTRYNFSIDHRLRLKSHIKTFTINHSNVNYDLYYTSSETDETEEQEDTTSNNIEISEFPNSQKNNLTINDNINRNGSLSHENFVKLTNLGYHLGRVGYPSSFSSRLSANNSSTNTLRSSRGSINSFREDNTDKGHEGPVFYLDINRRNNEKSTSPDYQNINIPHSIVEEDEINSINNGVHDIRLKTFKQQ